MAELNYKRFMFKKLCILLIFKKIKVTKILIDKYRMHILICNIRKITEHMQANCRQFSQ